MAERTHRNKAHASDFSLAISSLAGSAAGRKRTWAGRGAGNFNVTFQNAPTVALPVAASLSEHGHGASQLPLAALAVTVGYM